jgi:hypothetical protein
MQVVDIGSMLVYWAATTNPGEGYRNARIPAIQKPPGRCTTIQMIESI